MYQKVTCVFVGKTHTIVGSDDEPGIITRVVQFLSQRSVGSKDTSVFYSYLEIYQEKVSDIS